MPTCINTMPLPFFQLHGPSVADVVQSFRPVTSTFLTFPLSQCLPPSPSSLPASNANWCPLHTSPLFPLPCLVTLHILHFLTFPWDQSVSTPVTLLSIPNCKPNSAKWPRPCTSVDVSERSTTKTGNRGGRGSRNGSGNHSCTNRITSPCAIDLSKCVAKVRGAEMGVATTVAPTG